MKKLLIVLVAVVGTFGLLAALHHVVVITARGTAFSNAFADTCAWCHGDTYSGFGRGAPE